MRKINQELVALRNISWAATVSKPNDTENTLATSVHTLVTLALANDPDYAKIISGSIHKGFADIK